MVARKEFGHKNLRHLMSISNQIGLRTVPGNQGFIAAILRLNGIYNNGEVMVYHPLMSKCANETLHGRPQTPAA